MIWTPLQCIDVDLAEQKNVKIYAVRAIVAAKYNNLIAFIETSFPKSRLGYENQ